MKTTKQERLLLQDLLRHFGTQVSRVDLYATANKYGIKHPVKFTKNKVGWGIYDITEFTTGLTVFGTQSATVPAAASAVSVSGAPDAEVVVEPEQTDAEILTAIRKNFVTLDRMIQGVAAGKVRSMIVSGPAGIGKTYTIESILDRAEEDGKIIVRHVSGFARATGLFKLLYQNRFPESVLVLDDIDSIFSDENALNILKGALDTKKRRVITWGSEKVFVDSENEIIPNEFEFKGSVIFITNLDFEKMIGKDRANAVHYKALISRSFYIDVNLNSAREFMLRVKDVFVNTDMGFGLGLDKRQEGVVVEFLAANIERIREISLRMIVKLAQIIMFAESDDDFRGIATATCLRRKTTC